MISRDSLWDRLRRGATERARFTESHLSKNLAFQVRAMREKKEWSQIELGNRVDMNQNAISRLENPFYGKATLTTLKRIAAAFDVALIVRFVPFSQLANWVSGTPFIENGLSMESMEVPTFEEEDMLQRRFLVAAQVPNAITEKASGLDRESVTKPLRTQCATDDSATKAVNAAALSSVGAGNFPVSLPSSTLLRNANDPQREGGILETLSSNPSQSISVHRNV